MINFQTKTVRQGINKAYLKVAIKRADLDAFKEEATTYLKNLEQAEGEREEHFKGFLKDFLQNTFYTEAEKLVNTSDNIDLAIYSGKSTSSSVDVIIEAKRPSNKAEMISKEKLNQKAFQEALHYYFDDREKGNDSIKQVVITNYTEFFIFDAQEIERLFYSKKKMVKAYREWKDDGKVSSKTEFIYGKFEEFIKNSEGTLTSIYVDLNSYKKQLGAKAEEETDKKLIPLFKLFSPEHLTKKSFANDSNSLDKGFYNELLHILGLQEVKEGSKRLIQRLPEENRNPGSLVENTIATLKYDQHMNEVRDAKVQYGDSEDDQLFGVALELVITWMNRVLFLKLLEAQLLAYHQFDAKFKFLVFKGIIDEYDELNKLFFRVLALKNNERPELLKNRFGHIPYLNSSLFDSTALEKATIQISGLDDKASLPIYNRSVFRKSANPPKGSLTTLEYLLRFLDAYNFSAESSGGIQTEDKALINASVLGLIFEKINGYKDGSFFTPGFITEYMARETLRKSVVDKLNQAFDWDCKVFEELHRKVESKSLEEVNAVINSITICDPAVGSGHFLVSCLNELLAIKAELKVLCDVEGKRIPYLDIEVENDELAIEHNGELFEYKVNHEWKNDIVERSHAGKDRQRIQQALFHEKRFLIEHCLFGVDINPNSVKICRLRLWIELLKHAYYKESSSTQTLNQVQGDVSVEAGERKASHPEDTSEGSAKSDASYTPYSELEVLPNIDINIKQGNSLVSRFDLDEDLTAIFKKSEHSLEDYKQAVKNYRETRDRNEKQRLQKLIDDIKEEFSIGLEQLHPERVKLKELIAKHHKLTTQFDMFGDDIEGEAGSRRSRIKKAEQELEKQQNVVNEMEAGILYREAFEWRFEFPEVLDDNGNYTGFDVVIGNPPYIDIKALPDKFVNYLTTQYVSSSSRINIFASFLEHALKIIKQSSFSLSFILPTALGTQQTYRNLRVLITDNYTIDKYVRLPNEIFGESAGEVKVDTAIYVLSELRKKSQVEIIAYVGYERIDEINPETAFINGFKNQVNWTESEEYVWNINTTSDEDELLKKCEANSISLENVSRISLGLTPYDKYTGQTKEQIENKVFHASHKKDETFKKLLSGNDVRRYSVKWNGESWISYGSWLGAPREQEFFTEKRILVKQIIDWSTKRIWSSIIDDELYNTQNAFNILKDSEYELEYILGLLNSNLLTFYHRKKYLDEFKMRFQKILIKDARRFPIKEINFKKSNAKKTYTSILDKVTQILSAKKENPEADTSKLEAEIDHMVYELYGLTEEEIAIVEESVG